MLRIYYSNRLDVLAEIIGLILHQQPLSDSFEPETIIVQSNGMAQWLQITLAEQAGIAANLHFPLPTDFIWKMFSQILPDMSAAQNDFTRQNMLWKLMTLLPAHLENPAFASLRHYLHDDLDQHKIFQLCWRVADLYDQYQIYRPHWLSRWQSGEHIAGLSDDQQWQSLLWQTFMHDCIHFQHPQWNRASLYQQFIRQLEQTTCPQGLPSRIFVCGISSLPPVYLQALQALGHHCDVHLMVMNPCRHYWADIRDTTTLAYLMQHQRQTTPTPASFVHHQAGNPLLASWGKQGRDYLSLLTELSHFEEIDAFADIPPDSLLHHLQRDLLELCHPAAGAQAVTETSSHKQIIQPTDQSIRIHVCHSPQREMEVLHDQLLAMLEQNPQLNVRDIIVMVPDIDNYSPFIQAVFGSASGERYLPYAISDRRTRQLHPVLQAAITLFSLPESRFNAEEILQLLEIPALASRFNIDESGLHHLRQWINESGIRWGIDDHHVREWDLPATGQHTWQFGIRRMLLGYAMDSSAGQWQSLLPYDESSGMIASLIGQLASLLDQLANWRNILSTPCQAQDWLPVCRQLLDDFFVRDQQTSEILALLEQQWRSVIEPILNARYPQPVPLNLLRDELESQLEQQRFSQRFLAGAINFCTLLPMRSIPFKVICLAGMNDNAYPRPTQPLGFDLMRQQPMPGDRSRRDDDRYLLLEALICTQQQFYISYIGHNIQDNQPCFPSILIQELLDYIGQNYCLQDDAALRCDDSASRLLKHLTQEHTRTAFDPINFLPADPAQSYAVQWLPAASGQGQRHKNFIQPLPALPVNELDIDNLQRFWRHPVRCFFQMRLKVNLDYHTEQLPNCEPFSLNALQRYQLRQKLLDILIDNADPQSLYQRYRSAGQLPYGAFGDIFWQQQLADIQPLAQKIQQHYRQSQPLEIDLSMDNIHLTGWINQVQDNGILRWYPTSLDARHAIQLWLEHLLCCLSGNPVESWVYGLKDSQWHFLPLSTDEARAQLQPLISGYQQGLCQPLILLPKCATAWLNACYNPQTRQIDQDSHKQYQAQNKLADAFNGGYQQRGEGEDIWYQRLWRNLDSTYSQAIIDCAQHWLLPIWQHNQPKAKAEKNRQG